jgi:hypothetical protein
VHAAGVRRLCLSTSIVLAACRPTAGREPSAPPQRPRCVVVEAAAPPIEPSPTVEAADLGERFRSETSCVCPGQHGDRCWDSPCREPKPLPEPKPEPEPASRVVCESPLRGPVVVQ